MASIQEIMLQLEGKKSPFEALLEGAAGGFQNAQNDALNNARQMLLMEEKRRQMEQQAAMEREIKARIEAQTQSELKDASGAPTAVAPKQKFKEVIEQGKDGYTRRFETVDVTPKADSFEDFKYKDKQGKVRIGLINKSTGIRQMGDTDPLAEDTGGGISPSLAYQMGKDKDKEALEAKGKIIPGWKLTGDVEVGDLETRKLRDGAAEWKTFQETVKEYKGLVQKYGTSEITDPAVQGQMQALSKNLQLKVKNLAQLGVLSISDIPFIEEQIPGPGMFKFTSKVVSALETADKMMEKSIVNKMKVSGYEREGAAGGAGDGTGGAAARKAPPGKILVSNGKETRAIDPADAADAAKDGYTAVN